MSRQLEKVGTVASFIRGINFKPDDVVAVGTEGTVACMRTKNVQPELDLTDVWAVSREFVGRQEQILSEGDILVSSANSWNLVGKCCWIPKLNWPASFGGFVSVLRAKREKIDSRYLYRWFSSEQAQAQIRNCGQKTTSISNLNLDRCLNLELPVPGIEEQRRIAAILDQADALRAKRREALAELDGLAQAIFVEMFGDQEQNPMKWPVQKFGALILEGPQNGLYKPSSDYGSGTPILRIDAFYDGVVTKLDSLKRVRLSPQDIKLFGLEENDIVVNRVNSIEYLGKSAIIPPLSEATVFESNMMRIKADQRMVIPCYLIQVLQTKFIKRQILSCSKNAVNQSSINQQDVKSWSILVPPIALQETFVKRIQALESLKATHRTALTELDALFASLQHRAFRGEL
jgi:type I restriction enzyme S subunit